MLAEWIPNPVVNEDISRESVRLTIKSNLSVRSILVFMS